MKGKFNRYIIAGILGVLILGVAACEERAARKKHDSSNFTDGVAQIVADESFAPIINEELYVFKASYPDAKPQMIYASENEVLNYLLSDSIRFAILSRNLTDKEAQLLRNRTLPPKINKFAIDAVAIIVSTNTPDTAITVSQIKQMLNGKLYTDRNIVFDNPNSSLVRYLREFSGDMNLKQKNIYALKSNKEVIKYVSEHPGAIGITGFSWLNDPDTDYADAVKKVKILAVNDDTNKKLSGQYFRPSQETLYLKQYPLSRSLYIVDCTGRVGLAMGFAAFIESERGQRIILKSGLMPDSIPHRDILLDKDMKL